MRDVDAALLRQPFQHPLLSSATVVMDTSILPIIKGQISNPRGFWREGKGGAERRFSFCIGLNAHTTKNTKVWST